MYRDKKRKKNRRNIFSVAAAIGFTVIFAGVGIRIFGTSEKEAEKNNKSFYAFAELDKHMAEFEGGAKKEAGKGVLEGKAEKKTQESFEYQTKETKPENIENNTNKTGQEDFEGTTNATGQATFRDNTDKTRQEASENNTDKAKQEVSEGRTETVGQENFEGTTNAVGQENLSGKENNANQMVSEEKTEAARQENFEEKTETVAPSAPEIPKTEPNQNVVLDTKYAFTDAPEGYFEDALFIGDSRTVGLAEYGNLEGADFFAAVGMSVYNIEGQRVDAAGEKNINIETLLSNHSYGKIYFMLGLNELGYNRQKTVDRYRAWVEYIQQMQPQAIIFIEANLHVTAKRSASNEESRNEDIDEFNNYTKELADNRNIFYVDVNELFDDAGGSLSADLTYDGVHILAKHYADWGEWLRKKAVVR